MREEHTKHLILKATGLCKGDPQALVNWETVPKRPLMDTDWPAQAQWRSSYWERAQATWERGLFAYLESLSLRCMLLTTPLGATVILPGEKLAFKVFVLFLCSASGCWYPGKELTHSSGALNLVSATQGTPLARLALVASRLMPVGP